MNKAQIHLANQGVGAGDLFLFFGWFREVVCAGGRWSFRRGAPDVHALFGWLQVDEAIDVVAGKEAALRRHPWLRAHPHLSSTGAPNAVHVASERLGLPGVESGSLPGAGVFPRLAPDLVLTRPGQRLRSRWRLPSFFYPALSRPPLSYHEQLNRWTLGEDGVDLPTVGRGQEFVLDLAAYPEAARWAFDLVSNHGG